MAFNLTEEKNRNVPLFFNIDELNKEKFDKNFKENKFNKKIKNKVKKDLNNSILNLSIISIIITSFFIASCIVPFVIYSHSILFSIFSMIFILMLFTPFYNFYFALFYHINLKRNKNFYDYYLPLSSNQIIDRIRGNDTLKNIIINKIKEKNYITHQTIDNILGIKNKIKFYVETIDENYFFKNDIEKDIFKESVLSEQSKIIFIDFDYHKYEVEYKIDNGPAQKIFLSHKTKDESTFHDFISNYCFEKYNRGCKILSINEVN